MKTTPILIEKIIAFLKNDIQMIYGSYIGRSIDNIASSDAVNEHSLDWINPSKTDKQLIAESTPAQVILVDKSVVYSDKLKKENKLLLVVAHPKISLAKVGNEFFVPKHTSFIHPTAIIDKSAKIGKNVHIGPYVVVGKCEIGDTTFIDSQVKIHDEVKIGHSCVIKSGSILGGPGFGFERDENDNLFRFPQIGKLIIGNHVEIGSLSCIDRGSLSDTHIDDYVKIDNLVHIAHNVIVGKNVVITGRVGISGSCSIEENVWISPGCIVNPWIRVGANTILGTASVITKDVPANEVWYGNPAKKIADKNTYINFKQ